jgi:hypothetical protein
MRARGAILHSWVLVAVGLVVFVGACTSEPVPPPATTSLTSLNLVCDEEGSHVSSQLVQALADGVHVHVSNRFEQPIGFLGHVLVPPGLSFHVESISPGKQTYACGAPSLGPYPPNATGPGPWKSTVTFTVLDPNRYYVRIDDLACGSAGGRYSGKVTAMHPGESLPEALRKDAAGLKPKDTIRAGGYPSERPNRQIGVWRQRTLVAIFYYEFIGGRSWRRGGFWSCVPGIAWK